MPALILFESGVPSLRAIASEIFKKLSVKNRNNLLSILVDSPIRGAYSFALEKIDEIFKENIPKEILLQLLEHSKPEVKAFTSLKIKKVIETLDNNNKDLFLYYAKTLLLLPNLHSKSKSIIYQVLPKFALTNKEKISEIEELLIEIGSSNIILDAERALVALAKIRNEVI